MIAAPVKKAEVKIPEQPTVAPSVVSAYDSAKRTKLIEWVEQLKVKADNALAETELLKGNITQSELLRKTAENNLVTLQTKIDDLSDWGITQQERADKADAKLAEVLPKYHFIKFWVSAFFALVLGGFVGLLIFHFAPQALNTLIGAGIGLGLPVFVGIIVFTFIQLKL